MRSRYRRFRQQLDFVTFLIERADSLFVIDEESGQLTRQRNRGRYTPESPVVYVAESMLTVFPSDDTATWEQVAQEAYRITGQQGDPPAFDTLDTDQVSELVTLASETYGLGNAVMAAVVDALRNHLTIRHHGAVVTVISSDRIDELVVEYTPESTRELARLVQQHSDNSLFRDRASARAAVDWFQSLPIDWFLWLLDEQISIQQPDVPYEPPEYRPKPPPTVDDDCGTITGYHRHRQRGEDVCTDCWTADRSFFDRFVVSKSLLRLLTRLQKRASRRRDDRAWGLVEESRARANTSSPMLDDEYETALRVITAEEDLAVALKLQAAFAKKKATWQEQQARERAKRKPTPGARTVVMPTLEEFQQEVDGH